MPGSVTCNGNTYIHHGLIGYGLISSNALDKFGDTLGGIGSSVAIEQSSWERSEDGTYKGVAWCLPDRGWNREGTLNFQNRVHKIELKLTLNPDATSQNPSSPNLELKYLETILFTGPDDTPTTGIDANAKAPYLSYPGFPTLPSAEFDGNGFGQPGTGGHHIALDCEGLVLGSKGTFWVGDEYGAYIYQFSATGKMLQAIRPPEAFIPRRHGADSFSSASPPIYNPSLQINPKDPDSGRGNNQGLEGFTVSPDGKRLYALLQSALNQEGGKPPSGSSKKTRRHARLLVYDISEAEKATYAHSYVVPLPMYDNEKKAAGNSDILYVTDTQFLILARDSNAGHGAEEETSLYRQVDIFDISEATDIRAHSAYDEPTGAIASDKGKLKDGITPAKYVSFLDINDNSELAKFKLHNGGAQDQWLLNEKWESIAVVPVLSDKDKLGSQGPESGKQFFMFCFSDNDFVTQDGWMDFGRFPYKDGSGYELDNQALVFQVSLPGRESALLW